MGFLTKASRLYLELREECLRSIAGVLFSYVLQHSIVGGHLSPRSVQASTNAFTFQPLSFSFIKAPFISI